jgi:transcriptional regulator with XRE-family HTH domain
MREARGIKQGPLAEGAAITRPMLSAYERGRVVPTLETLQKILEFLETDFSELTTYMDYVGPYHPQNRHLAPAKGPKPPATRPEPTPTPAPTPEVAQDVPPDEALQRLLKAIEVWLQATWRASQPPRQPAEDI